MLGLRRSVWSHCSLAGLANLAVVASLSPRIVICKTGIVLGPASNGLNVKCLVQCVAVQAIHECMRATLLKSYLTLCDSMDCSLPGSSVHGVLQARILQWVAVPSSRGSSRSRDWTQVSYGSCIGRWPPGKPSRAAQGASVPRNGTSTVYRVQRQYDCPQAHWLLLGGHVKVWNRCMLFYGALVLVIPITIAMCNVFWSAHNYTKCHPLYI